MDDSATGSASPRVPSPARSPWDAAGLLALINGVLVGVGGVYLATQSVTITLIAGLAAFALASLVLILHR
jgi:hypothetical protein